MLDVTKPTDVEHVSQLPYWIRQTRAEVNALVALDSNITTTSLTLTAGTTKLIIPTNLSLAALDFVLVSTSGTCNIASIEGGANGQVKVFIFQTNDVALVDGAKSNGQLFLNQAPVGSIYSASIDDILALMNIGGNGSTVQGYWKELWRQTSVK